MQSRNHLVVQGATTWDVEFRSCRLESRGIAIFPTRIGFIRVAPHSGSLKGSLWVATIIVITKSIVCSFHRSIRETLNQVVVLLGVLQCPFLTDFACHCQILAAAIFCSRAFPNCFIATNSTTSSSGCSSGGNGNTSRLSGLAVFPPCVWITGIAPDRGRGDHSSWPAAVIVISKAIGFSHCACRPALWQIIMTMGTLRRPFLACFS